MRRFVIVGTRALASPDFRLLDLPGTSGRLDVLLRCVRAGLLVSHGVRRDTTLYLVLLGGPCAPRTLRFDGEAARYLRPDDRSLAVLAQKALQTPCETDGFVRARPGVFIARGGLDAVLTDLGGFHPVVLDEGGEDLRAAPSLPDSVYFLGDHRGFDDATRARLDALAPASVSVGPVSLHAEDVVAVVANELDRRGL